MGRAPNSSSQCHSCRSAIFFAPSRERSDHLSFTTSVSDCQFFLACRSDEVPTLYFYRIHDAAPLTLCLSRLLAQSESLNDRFQKLYPADVLTHVLTKDPGGLLVASFATMFRSTLSVWFQPIVNVVRKCCLLHSVLLRDKVDVLASSSTSTSGGCIVEGTVAHDSF